LAAAFSVLVGCAGGDCPKAEVVTDGTDVNAKATEAVINARGIDTCNVPPESVAK
jgi:hypothetical protein